MEVTDDGLFVVEGNIVSERGLSGKTVRAALRGLPRLSAEQANKVREWMKTHFVENFVSTAEFPDGTIEILAYSKDFERTMVLNDELKKLLAAK